MNAISPLPASFIEASAQVARLSAEEELKAAGDELTAAETRHYEFQTMGSNARKDLRDAASTRLAVALVRLDRAKKAWNQYR